ncbi:Hypothetical protein Trvi_ORF141 [Trabala vishnou gigantina nucleopolyhedrovirus]|uniref:Hypothetical protein n=1 Tax=Trabala vishnou gigantina nucleopolyhedrovirus TaxID=2863583 RepID=UPI002481E8B0|nr:Hypothetical protein QKU87_gp141 [Trabala vishnou gigantina nucleopolyhedrovirus]QYC92737.1 Hypothetical protein Trvi_ORF141 [Trabala vishnou gigantina nucleopolyhedrovirus]
MDNIMSTLRNKLLIKNLQSSDFALNDNADSSSNTNAATPFRVLSFTEMTFQKDLRKQLYKYYKQPMQIVSVENLKRISEAFAILKNSNKKLVACLKSVSTRYEQRYKMRLKKLSIVLNRKIRRLQKLRQKLNCARRYIMIVRQNNTFTFYTNVNCIKKNNFKIIVYKLSVDPVVDKAVCISVAKTKYGERANVLLHKTIVFASSVEADSFAEDIKQMFVQ